MKSKNGNRFSIVLAFCFVTVFLLATQGAIVFLYNETYVYDYAILDKVNQLYNVAIKGSCILAIGVFLFSVYCLTQKEYKIAIVLCVLPLALLSISNMIDTNAQKQHITWHSAKVVAKDEGACSISVQSNDEKKTVTLRTTASEVRLIHEEAVYGVIIFETEIGAYNKGTLAYIFP